MFSFYKNNSLKIIIDLGLKELSKYISNYGRFLPLRGHYTFWVEELKELKNHQQDEITNTNNKNYVHFCI